MFDVQSRGMEAYKKTWELFFASSTGGPGSFDITERQIAAGETVAFCHAILNIFDSKARLTMGLRKENGRMARRARASFLSNGTGVRPIAERRRANR